VRYSLEFSAARRHDLQVEVGLSGLPGPRLVLWLPTWTAGLYHLENYAREVFAFQARDASGHSLPWRKTGPSTWEVEGQGEITVRYQVRCARFPRWLDEEGGFLDLAGVLMAPEGAEDRPCRLHLELPPGWGVGFPGPADPEGYARGSYLQMIDSPLLLGRLREFAFSAGGRPHRLVLQGYGLEGAGRLVEHARALVDGYGRLMGGLPYDSYTFFVRLEPDDYFLEHFDSSVVALEAPASDHPEDLEPLLRQMSHEFFHVWNVERLRPAALVPLDLRRPQPTRLLWWFEGVTYYYESLMLARVGSIPAEQFYRILSDQISEQETWWPAAREVGLEDASLNAWLYPSALFDANLTTDYYLKGALVALLLDVELRHRTDGQRSLDDLVRLLYRRWGPGTSGLSEEALEEAASEVAGGSLEEFFRACVRGTQALPYREALDYLGLDLVEETPSGASLGIRFQDADGGGLRLLAVVRGRPAYEAGLLPGDVLIELGGRALDGGKDLGAALEGRAPGEAVRVKVRRSGRVLEVPVVLGARPSTWKVRPLPGASPAQVRARRAWLWQEG
jgi:predicted metalloprotease with PDZ domain